MSTNIKAMILNNITQHKFTTFLGCGVAAVSAFGEHLETYPQYIGYGKILTSIASFIGAVGLLLARNPNLVHNEMDDNSKTS